MFITEPGMAFAVGTIVFVVVVVGGMGSLAGAFVASLIIGTLQTFSVALDFKLLDIISALGISVSESSNWYGLLSITISQTAPVMPYLLMVLMLIVRPRGLMGTRET